MVRLCRGLLTMRPANPFGRKYILKLFAKSLILKQQHELVRASYLNNIFIENQTKPSENTQLCYNKIVVNFNHLINCLS